MGAGLPSAGTGTRGAQPGAGGAGGGFGGLNLAGLFGPGSAIGGILSTILPGIGAGLSSGSPVMGGLMGGLGALGAGVAAGMAAGLPLMSALIVAGPLAIVGAVIGIIFGIISRKKRAAKAFKDTQKIWLEAKKQIDETVKGYMDHQVGYEDALKQLDDIRSQTADALIQASAQDRHSTWGNRYISKRLDPAIADAKASMKKIEDERQARGQTTFGPAQFHSGGFTGAGSGEFNARLLRGEFVVNPMATAVYRSALEEINRKIRPSAASHFSSPPRFHSGGFAAPTSSGPEIHLHIHTIDGADTENWLRNRGGLRAISTEMNRARREYSP
ncbi:MAG: hypothetical protein M3O85_04405 [Acidobacteriota bacterium]|nr:hypothetical protein [Acidobacteriota bacterium]